MGISFYRFGFPKIIISDQGREFNNKMLDEILEQVGTEHRRTSPYHPQCNGHTGKFPTLP